MRVLVQVRVCACVSAGVRSCVRVQVRACVFVGEWEVCVCVGGVGEARAALFI